ncbi:MAG: glycosyltransferase [Sphingomonadales bacterium]|jgi:hypothetical protein
MKILIITGFFPPYCPPATTRMPSFARYLLEQGHDVRVVCPYQTQYKPFLEPGIESGRIHYVSYYDVDRPPQKIKKFLSLHLKRLSGVSNLRNSTDVESTIQTEKPARRRSSAKLRAFVSNLYMTFVHFPDRQWTWIRPARREVEQLFKSWRPNIMFVSTPPYSQLFLANTLAEKYDIPWIAEYRDTWSVQPYYSYPRWRQRFESWVEKRVTKSAKRLFTVTYLAAEEVGEALKRPILVARNGFDQEDFDALEDRKPIDKQVLTILYGGAVYGGLRDPTPLFEALALLRNEEVKCRAIIYTSQTEQIRAAAQRIGVEDFVDLREPITREEFLSLELGADVLLLMRGVDPKEDSVVPGKLYEYIGARRPILALGSTTGEAVDIIRSENLGLVSNDAKEIAAQLKKWYDEKTVAGGQVLAPQVDEPERYSRKRQFQKILKEFEAVLHE